MPPSPTSLRLPPASAHAVAAVVMTAAALFEASQGGADARLTPLNATVSVLTGAVLLVARFSPVGAVVLLTLTIAVPSLLVTDLPPIGGAQLIATMLVVAYAGYRLQRRAALVVYAVLVVVPSATIVIAGEAYWEFLFFALILAPGLVVGRLLAREQQRSAELILLTEELRQEREKQAQVAVAAERVRISRELHDAVAHTVSVMTLQVGVVRRRQEPGSVEEETLHSAEQLGRQAVDELRRIVGIVREGEAAALAPLPSLEQVDDLVQQVRSAGTEVTLRRSGELSEVQSAVQASAYRIVQEGLTNALKHAPGSSVEVGVRVTPETVELEVVNTRPSRSATTAPGGHGLVGLRERAHLLGGELTSEPLPDGGHRLRAVLPLHTTRPRLDAVSGGAS